MGKKRAAEDENENESENEAVRETLHNGQPERGENSEIDEVPAISHAEQRKRRKLERRKARAAEDGDYGEGETATAKDAASVAEKPNKSGKKIANASARHDKDGAEAPRSGFGVWIGNLAFKTDAEKLRTFLSSRMSQPVTRVNMPKGPKDRSGQLQPNKGFAYVDFADQGGVDAAIALSEEGLDGRRLLIKDAKSFEGRPASAARLALKSAGDAEGPADPTTVNATASTSTAAAPKTLSKSARKILDRQKNAPAMTLFVGNLGFESTAESIQEAFVRNFQRQKAWATKEKVNKKGKGKAMQKPLLSDEASEEDEQDSDDNPADDAKTTDADLREAGIRKVRIGTFEDSGKCKGWAFVDFYEIPQATAALVNSRNHHFNGRTLNIEYASADAVKRGGGRLSAPKTGSAYEPKRTKPFQRKIKASATSFQDKKRADAKSDLMEKTDGTQLPTAFGGKVHKPNQAERAALRAERAAQKSGGGRSRPNGARKAPEAIVAAAGSKTVF